MTNKKVVITEKQLAALVEIASEVAKEQFCIFCLKAKWDGHRPNCQLRKHITLLRRAKLI
jgi:hypothetical protein